MTVWPNVLSRVQSSSQLDLEKCYIPHQTESFLQLSAKFIWVNSSTSNCKRFHLHQTRLDTEVLTPSRPANAPSLFAKFGRQLLVGPQDAWRPNQTFHLLQFWARLNEACCWPLVSSGKLVLCPLCCIQGSKLVPRFRLSKYIFGPKLTSCKLGHKGSFESRCLDTEDIQILLLDLERNSCGKPGSPRSPAHCFAEGQLFRGFVCLCEPRLRQREINGRTSSFRFFAWCHLCP